MGQILKANLTTGETGLFFIPPEWERQYLGGASLGARMLYDRLTPELVPLSPQAPLLFINGPLSGTAGPVVGRSVVCARSPLTGLWGESNFGGFWGAELRLCGYLGLWVEGRAETPVYLWIQDQKVEVRSAIHLWGLDTYQTQAAIQAELDAGKISVAAIGPAGEKIIPYALILTDHGRVAGRTGMGAVMGSKNLKAIAVSGTSKTPIADRAAYDEAVKQIRENQKENPTVVGMQMNGTAGLISVVNVMGALPTKNFQTGTFEAAEEIAGSAITEKNRVKGFACASCPVGCSLISEIKSGAFAGRRSEGPEYESTVMLGSNLNISNLDTIIAANYLCDELGLDTISAGNVIGFAMECYEKGLLTDADTGGISITWGNGDALLSLLELIAKKEGIGTRLSQGVARLSKEIPSSEAFAMHVKGLELAAYDPRGVFGQGLSYAIAPRGGEHGRGGYMIVEFFLPDVDLYTHEGKAARAIELAELAAVYDMTCLCNFNFVPLELIPPLINAIVGGNYTEADLRAIARRTITLERRFNIREGFSRKDDTLPPRLLNEPLPDGMAAGKKVEGLDIMLDEYYTIMGWDKEGIPPKA